jgi:hypothetical protein
MSHADDVLAVERARKTLAGAGARPPDGYCAELERMRREMRCVERICVAVGAAVAAALAQVLSLLRHARRPIVTTSAPPRSASR